MMVLNKLLNHVVLFCVFFCFGLRVYRTKHAPGVCIVCLYSNTCVFLSCRLCQPHIRQRAQVQPPLWIVRLMLNVLQNVKELKVL